MEHHQPAGSTAASPWTVRTGLGYAELSVLELPPGGAHTVATGEREMLVVPLAGSAEVACGGEAHTLAGRAGVFDALTDFSYLPRRSEATITSARGGRFALPAAPATADLPFRYQGAGDVAVELRGAGACSRQVNNLAAAGGFACDRLIVVEVLTPDGNWSSYPPHKHDEHTAAESELEEVYYFEIGGDGVGYHRVYGTPERPIDVLAEVRTGDVVLVPHGWHGPSIAAPGYPMYYLNVMAGPHPERAWRITDDPAYAWIRGRWADESTDPRLPMTGGGTCG